MTLFDKAKDKKITKNCQNCNKEFTPDKRNTNRGWGLCCDKSCAASYKNKLNKLKGKELTKEVRDKKLKQLGL